MGDEPATRDDFRLADISAASARSDPAIYGGGLLAAAYPLTWDGPNGVFLAREVDGEIVFIAGACRIMHGCPHHQAALLENPSVSSQAGVICTKPRLRPAVSSPPARRLRTGALGRVRA